MKPWIPIAALALALSPLSFLHPVRVSGSSMEPALRDGAICWSLRSWCAGRPARGQRWLVEGPEGPVVKRVIGLPGERLEQREGVLFLDGLRLEEPYLSQYDQGTLPPMDAATGFLVLGDNRRESRDSRAWGPLPISAFKGRILGS